MSFYAINLTNIVLLQKIPHLMSSMNFRPISLCNVIYKLIAKMIVNHMKRVINICIDKAQSAFIPGSLISDNLLLAYELLHTYHQK